MIEYFEIAEFFKCFSDASRVKIIQIIGEGEKSVNDIAAEAQMTQTAVSYQLRILRDSRIVKYRREAQNIYYSLSDEHIMDLLNTTISHIEERKLL